MSLRRPKTVYGAPIRDPNDGNRVHIDYVGKTVRPLRVRELEHLGMGRNPDDEQPWSDLVDGPFIVLESDEHLPQPWSDAELAERERWWIRNQGGLLPHRPRYNWEFNAGCPGQIPKPRAAEQRALRDHQRGVVSRWTHPQLFPARPAVSRTVSSRPVPSTPVPPTLWTRLAATRPARTAKRRLHAAARVVVPWVVGVPAVWATLWLLAVIALHQPARAAASNVTSTLIAAAIVYGLARGWWAGRTRPKRRNRRRAR